MSGYGADHFSPYSRRMFHMPWQIMDLHGIPLSDQDLANVAVGFPCLVHVDLSFCKVTCFPWCPAASRVLLSVELSRTQYRQRAHAFSSYVSRSNHKHRQGSTVSSCSEPRSHLGNTTNLHLSPGYAKCTPLVPTISAVVGVFRPKVLGWIPIPKGDWPF